VVNIANILAVNDSRPYFLEGNVVAPNNYSDKEDNLEGMLSFFDC